MIPQITCSGTPYELGHQHGTLASAQVAHSISFYANLFKQTAGLKWAEVQATALSFEPNIAKKWPRMLEEMRGLADGANVPLADILALNVRTEIAFGLDNRTDVPSDGCTALSYHSSNAGLLAQNWDWMTAQSPALIALTLHPTSTTFSTSFSSSSHLLPTIKIVTEAGIIGKIGLSSLGVGVCLNAIAAPGLDRTLMPVHLALRLVLESPSRAAAVAALEGVGVASACHMLVADGEGAMGLEWSRRGVRKLEMGGGGGKEGWVFHSNHYVLEHEGVVERGLWRDSVPRLERIRTLAEREKETGRNEVDVKTLQRMLADEQDAPASICRKEEGTSTAATLFSIVMDLKGKRAWVDVGRPVDVEEKIEFAV